MNYPLISEYIESILNAEDNFDKLSHLRPVFNETGSPIMSSGNFAVVFKMTDGEKYYAIKCFTKEQEGREKAYKLISEELKDIESPYLVKFSFYNKELFVDSSQTQENEFPVVCMDWVDGITLTEFIKGYSDSYQFLYEYTDGGLWTYDEYKGLHLEDLHILSCHFEILGKWLKDQKFAHGDLKPDNILVRKDGTLVLVDYDGMFVPSMEGQSRREMGSPDFNSPSCALKFDASIDNFAITTISLQLELLSADANLWLYNHSAFPLTKADYLNIAQSENIRAIMETSVKSQMCMHLFGELICELSCKALNHRQSNHNSNILLDTDSKGELDTFTDEYGVVYSSDRKRLISGASFEMQYEREPIPYIIPEGTEVICNDAFYMQDIEAVIFPSTLKAIGKDAFCDTPLRWVEIPESVYQLGDCAFCGCGAEYAIIKGHLEYVGSDIFAPDDNGMALSKVVLFEGVEVIGDSMFRGCQLESFVIPSTIKKIGDNPFEGCKMSDISSYSSNFFVEDSCLYEHNSRGLKVISYFSNGNDIDNNLSIKEETSIIGAAAFAYYDKGFITIPKSVVELGKRSFEHSDILEIELPDGISRISMAAFQCCRNLQWVRLPAECEFIEESAFNGCSQLAGIYWPNNLRSIADHAFWQNPCLHRISIPKTVTFIGDCAFEKSGIIDLEVSNEYYETKNSCLIDKRNNRLLYAFGQGNIIVPSQVEKIGAWSFHSHKSRITSVFIPEGVSIIEKCSFWGCENLHYIVIPQSVQEIGDSSIFEYCDSLEQILVYPNSYACSRLMEIPSLRNRIVVLSPTVPNLDDILAMLNIMDDVYSTDGKKMINYFGTYPLEYKVNEGTEVLCDFCMNDLYSECDGHYIKKLFLPRSLKLIGENVFCGSISSIINESDCFITDEDCLWSKDKKILIRYFGEATSYTIPEGTVRIESGAFSDKDMESIVIPQSVQEIGDNPWINTYDCTCNIISYSNRFIVEDSVLYDAYTKTALCIVKNHLKEAIEEAIINIKEGTKRIGKHAFLYWCKLPDIYIPSSVEYIDQYAFRRNVEDNFCVCLDKSNFYELSQLFPKWMKDTLQKL